MNDYFLKILIQQRHAENFTELKLARRSQLERPLRTRRINRILESFLSSGKDTRLPTAGRGREKYL